MHRSPFSQRQYVHPVRETALKNLPVDVVPVVAWVHRVAASAVAHCLPASRRSDRMLVAAGTVAAALAGLASRTSCK